MGRRTEFFHPDQYELDLKMEDEKPDFEIVNEKSEALKFDFQGKLDRDTDVRVYDNWDHVFVWYDNYLYEAELTWDELKSEYVTEDLEMNVEVLEFINDQLVPKRSLALKKKHEKKPKNGSEDQIQHAA